MFAAFVGKRDGETLAENCERRRHRGRSRTGGELGKTENGAPALTALTETEDPEHRRIGDVEHPLGGVEHRLGEIRHVETRTGGDRRDDHRARGERNLALADHPTRRARRTQQPPERLLERPRTLPRVAGSGLTTRTAEIALRTQRHSRTHQEPARPRTLEETFAGTLDRGHRRREGRDIVRTLETGHGQDRDTNRPENHTAPRGTPETLHGTGRIAENFGPDTIPTVIAYLRGTARAKNIVDVDGVGYLVHCATPLTVGTAVEIHVHTQVREDAISLYGFTTEDEKRVFEALVKVTGVGPTSALALLSGLGAGGIADAVTRRDTKALSSVKGIGAKVAEKIVTLINLPDGLAGGENTENEISALLQTLGYDRSTSIDAARKARETSATNGEPDEAQLLAEAIRHAQEGKART